MGLLAQGHPAQANQKQLSLPAIQQDYHDLNTYIVKKKTQKTRKEKKNRQVNAGNLQNTFWLQPAQFTKAEQPPDV